MSLDSLMDCPEARDFAAWLAAKIEGDDLDGVERDLMAVLMKVGAAALAQRLEGLDCKTRTFTEDGKVWRRSKRSRLAVHGLFGEVSVERGLYRDGRNRPLRCLVAERGGLVANWTPRAAKVALLSIAEMPFCRAEHFFGEVGLLGVSRSSLLRFARLCSDCWEEHREQLEKEVSERTPIPAEARSVVVSLDGVLVNLIDEAAAQRRRAAKRSNAKGPAGWKEASIGVIAILDAEGERLQTRRYGRMPEANKAATKAWLAAELKRIQKERPDLRVMEVADGAANLRGFLDTLHVDVQLVY